MEYREAFHSEIFGLVESRPNLATAGQFVLFFRPNWFRSQLQNLALGIGWHYFRNSANSNVRMMLMTMEVVMGK
jgi:hypothetical protein